MLEHAIYSVISPEGCAAILWHSRDFKAEAATALKMTSKDLIELGVADEIIREPSGGAHADWDAAAAAVKEALERTLDELSRIKTDRLRKLRWAKYEAMGVWGESASKTPADA
jgi:acetyl-CoA carboxylase carboxyl transferase subunit alpha